MTGSWRRRAGELALLGAFLFVLLELSARVYLFGSPGLNPARVNSVHEIIQADLVRVSSDSRLGFELKPDLDTYFKLVPFRTNSRGLRDAEYDVTKPKGTYRVAVLGSSFALPSGVAIEAAFHSRLEEELSRTRDRKFEFINFSVGMYGPAQILAMLETRALDYDPDLILVTATAKSAPLFLAQPTARSTPQLTSLPRFERTYPILQSFLFRLVEQRIAPPKSYLRVGFLEQRFIDLVRWGSSKPDPKGDGKQGGAFPPAPPPLHAPPIERLATLRDRTGIPVVLARIEIEGGEPTAADRALEERTRSLGLHYLSTRAAFRDGRPSDYWIYPLDPHPNERAHEIFAHEISRFLDSEGLLPSTRES